MLSASDCSWVTKIVVTRDLRVISRSSKRLSSRSRASILLSG
jgi:hypothetical protein